MARPNLLELLRSQQSVEKPNAEAPVVEKTNPLIELIKKQKESEPFEDDSFGNIQQIEKEKPSEINKVIDDFPSYKGIKEIASLVGNATPSPSLNDDEKVTLKKIYSRPDLTNEQKAKAFATMANEHYYFDDKTGLPVAVKHGEEIPVGKNIESVWGDDVSANEHSGLFATPINAAKNLAAFAPDFVKSAAGLIHLPFALATGETADWYKEIKQQTEALKMKTSQDSQTPILNTEGIENFSDFFDPKRWTVNPMNIVGVGSQAMSSIAQFILGGEVIKAFGVGSKAISKLAGIAGESEMTLGELGKSLGSDVLGAIGMRAKTKLPYLLAGIGVNMGEGEDYAKEAGIEGRERYAVGAIYGIAASAIETEMGFTGKIAKGKLKLMKDAIGKDLIKGWAKDAEGNITKESLKDLFEKSSVANVGFWNTVKGMGKETAKTMLGEGTEEVSQNFSKRLIGEAADKIEGRNDFKKGVATPEAVGDYINDFIGGALAAMGGTVITPRRSFSRQKYEEQSSQAFNAIASGKVDELNATLSSAEKKGLITPEQRKLADQKIAGYQNYYNQIKNLKIDDKQKKRVSDLVWTNENLKALIQEEKKKPEDLQLKLKTYEGLLSKGQKEIQTILNPAITNEMITVPEGADEQIDLFEEEKPSEKKPNTTVKPKAPTVKQEKKEVIPTSPEEEYDIKLINKLKSEKEVEEYLTGASLGGEVSEAIQNAAHNRIVELTQTKEEEVPPTKKKAEPDEAAKKKFAEHLEALNKLDDNFDNEKNFEAFELRKKLIKETSEKSRVPVPTEITEAIKAKEESSKKRSIKNDISEIVTQSEKELDDEKTKLEALKKKGIKKNELSFDKIDLEDESDFIKKQTDEDSSFKSFFDKHKSFENEDTKSPSNGQKAALESLGSTGILSEEEASHEGSTMADASSAIHEAVKRIQYLKVNAESDAKAKELKQYQSDIMKMMSLPGIVETAEKHHEKIKNFADVNEKNAKEKHDAISKEQTRLAKKVVEEEKDFKKDKLKKKILQLATLKTKIEKLHPEAFVKKEINPNNDLESKKAEIERRQVSPKVNEKGQYVKNSIFSYFAKIFYGQRGGGNEFTKTELSKLTEETKQYLIRIYHQLKTLEDTYEVHDAEKKLKDDIKNGKQPYDITKSKQHNGKDLFYNQTLIDTDEKRIQFARMFLSNDPSGRDNGITNGLSSPTKVKTFEYPSPEVLKNLDEVFNGESAKYDAELAALETKSAPLTNEVSKTEPFDNAKETATEKNKNNKSEKIVSQIEKNQKLVEGKSEDNKYYIINGEKYKRVTTVIPNDFDGDSTKYEDSRIAGTTVDTIVRNFFNGDEVEKPQGISEEAFNELIQSLTEIQDAIMSNGEIFLTNNIVLFDKNLKIAGEVDILSVDKNGNFNIYDIKTAKDFSKYDISYKGKLTKLENHTNQLSAYANLFYNQYGEKINKLGILPFEIKYDEGGNIQSLKKLPGKKLKYEKSIEKIIPLEKETPTEEEQKAEENKQQEQESEKKAEPINHTANLQSVIKEIDNNKGKPIKGNLVELPKQFNGKVGVEIEINGEKQVVHIASSSTKVEQNANQKSKGKALQGQFGIIPKALVESNAPVKLHVIKVGEVDASGKAWNVNGELKNKYGTPYGDKVEVWSGDKYIGVLQETVHPKEEAKLAKPKTDFEKLQQRMDEFSEKMEQNRLNENPHKKASAAYFKFEQARQLEKDKLQKEYADVTGKKQGIGISDAQIKAFVYGVLAEVAKVVDKLKRKDAVEKGYKDLRKYLNANKEEITVEQAMAAESTFEKELEQPKKQTEEVEDTAGVNSQNMSAQARYFQNKEKIRSFYTGIRDFENDTQIEKLLNEVMLDKTFNKGKPFEEDIEGSIKELYRQGREELSDKKLSLAKRLESLLNSKQKEGERWSGREKVSQISMFFRNTHNQPYIAMNIASKGTADLIFVNGAYEKTLKDRALHALTKITDKQFEQKIADFKKTKKTMADQFALLKDLTGLEEKYWQRFLLAPKIKGDEISKLPYFVIGNETTAKQTSVFEGKTKRDFINNLVNKKGSVVNTITLATPAHEQLSVIKPIFKDSEWNSRTSSSFSTHLISALNNVNNSVYANSPFYKNNNFVKQYIGKAKGAVIFMTSGASNIFKNKKFNAENMTDNDILKMMYAAYTQDIKDAPKEEDGTYLQCLGQFGDKGFLSWTKCQKYTNLAEAKKHFADINKRNGLDAEAQEKMLIEEAKENTKQLFSSPTELQEKQAELFTFNYAINYAEVNEVVNGGLLQYGEGQQGITALFKRNGSTASPGEAGSKYEKGGLGESHGIVLINAPKVDGFSFGDGQEYITREHSDKAKISTGGKYHSIIKAITSFTNPNGTRVLVKSGAIVIDELVKKFPDNEAYKAILKTMKDAGVGRIVTVDAAKLRKDTEIYNLFKEDSHELNPDAGEVSDKHIITVKTDDYLFQQDLVNDGKLKQSTTPIQRIKNMMGSKTAKAIQSQYNEIAKKKLDAFSEKISKIYGELDEKQKREAFTKFLLTNGKTTSEEAQSLLDEFDAEGMTGDDLDFINTLLVARVDNSHPILHSWAQRFIGNTIEKEALGRIANKVQLVEFAYIPGKGFELRDYRKTADGKTLLPEIAVPKSTGLRLPKTFKTKEAAIAAIINEKAKYRDMYDGEGLTEDSYGNVLEHEIEKTDKGWVVPGEYAMVTRVPADGMHSTTLARVKYHTPKEMGNVIITSVGMQKLAGSDFDGDTRFVEGFFKSPEGHILKDKETKQPLLNKKGLPKLDRVASNKATPKGMANKAFHTDAQYFYDTNNFDEITNGINDKAFDHILEKLPKEKEYAAFGPKTFLNARTKNTTGLRVVGIAARYIGAYDYLKKHNAFVGKVDEKGNPVPYYFPLAKINNAPTTKKLISKFASGWQMKKVMGNLLNLALDNVKNPKIERLGLNEVTVPMFYTSLMLKPQEISVEDWTEHVIAFYTQPEVKKFVKLVRDANSVFNEDKSQDIIGKVNRKVRNEEGNWEEDNSVFTPEENKVLDHLKTQYFISQDINKLSTVIGATEKGIKSWAEYKNVKYIINDINNNKLQNINTEKFVGSSFIQAAVESADAMKSFLAKDAYEETKFAKDILKTAEAEFDKVQKGKKKEGRFSLKQFEAFSKAVSDSMIALTRNLKTPWKDQRGDFVQSVIQSKKDLPGKIQKQIDLFNGLTAQYRTLDSTIKRLEEFGDKLNQLPSKKEEQEALKPKILAEKEKLDDLKAKNTIVQMLDNKSRNTAEFVDSDGQKIVKGDTYNSLGLRIDLQKQEMEADEKKVVYDAMDRLSKSDPKFITDFTNLVIFDTHMSTSRESGGLAQLLSPKIHEQIGSDMRKEKEKWDNDSYSKLEKAKIVDKIFENNPELLDKKYEKKLGESAIEKDYSAFAEGVLPVTFVKQETFDKVSDGSKNTITLSLGKNTMNHDTANKVKAGYQLNMSFEGKEIQREVAKVVKSENSVDITFKPLVKEKISDTDNIYSQLGNETQSKNVILPKDVDYEADGKGMEYTSAIDFWRKVVPEAMALFNKRQPLIVAFRGNSKKTFLQNYNSDSHTIGNPFNWQDEKGNRKEQGVISTKKFIKWMITGDNQGNNNATEEYRQAIIKDIKSGKLKGSSILYYEEKHYATHATALDYLINKYEWNKEQSSSQEQWNTHKEIIIDKNEEYSKERLNNSLGTAKTFMSNFEQLKNPIVDEFGNKYWNSEGFYMAQRTSDQKEKEEISKASKISGQESRNSKWKYSLEQNEEKRKEFMLNAIREKFKNNSELLKKLLATESKEIIEKNYWKDDLFGVREDTGKGANILGKTLMKVREELKQINDSWNIHKDELIKRHPDLTEEVWNSMSDMEHKKAIECL